MQREHLRNKGIEALEKGYIHSARVFLEQWVEHHNSPEARSYLAYCLAKARGQTDDAIQICSESLPLDPENPDLYLLMGRTYLLAGNKTEAINVFRQGLKIAKEPRLIKELNKLGLRKPSVFKTLKRNHPANRIMGKLLARLGFR